MLALCRRHSLLNITFAVSAAQTWFHPQHVLRLLDRIPSASLTLWGPASTAVRFHECSLVRCRCLHYMQAFRSYCAFVCVFCCVTDPRVDGPAGSCTRVHRCATATAPCRGGLPVRAWRLGLVWPVLFRVNELLCLKNWSFQFAEAKCAVRFINGVSRLTHLCC